MARGSLLMERPNRLVMLAGPTPGAEFALDRERLTVRMRILNVREETRSASTDRICDEMDAGNQHPADNRQRPRVSFNYLRQAVVDGLFDAVS